MQQAAQEDAASPPPPPSPPPRLDVKRQTRYFLRCLKTVLPQPYTANDSNRLTLAFFIVSALDLLDALHANTTDDERAAYRDWIYLNQHPQGGFRAFPGSNLGDANRTDENSTWDPAHVPATYFALCLLLILEDDLSRLRREECLAWLPRLQREDGSFGETFVDGAIRGGRDSRFGYCAAGIRYMLAGPDLLPESSGSSSSSSSSIERNHMNVDKLMESILSAESYDAGISFAPFHEAQAGFTFCALGVFAFSNRLNTVDTVSSATASSPQGKTTTTEDSGIRGPSDPLATIRWLVSRQTTIITEEDQARTPNVCQDAHLSASASYGSSCAQGEQRAVGSPPLAQTKHQILFTGFDGRCNKVADTCYAFWVGGSLSILGHNHLPHAPSVRRWLLQRTAHPDHGGFGKMAGGLPDVYHSYLGLATLGLMDDRYRLEDGVQELDAAMCISKRAKDRLVPLWKRWGVFV